MRLGGLPRHSRAVEAAPIGESMRSCRPDELRLRSLDQMPQRRGVPSIARARPAAAAAVGKVRKHRCTRHRCLVATQPKPRRQLPFSVDAGQPRRGVALVEAAHIDECSTPRHDRSHDERVHKREHRTRREWWQVVSVADASADTVAAVPLEALADRRRVPADGVAVAAIQAERGQPRQRAEYGLHRINPAR
eukprot:6075736-Prymnesium_polylepis.1